MSLDIIVPGVTTAGDDIELDQEVNLLTDVGVIDVNTPDYNELTIVDAAPAPGEAQLYDSTTLRLGDDTTVNDVIRLKGIVRGSVIMPA